MKLFCIYLKLREVPEEIRLIEEGLGKYREEYEMKYPDENILRTFIIYAEHEDSALIRFQVQYRKYLDLYDMTSIKILPVDNEYVFVIRTINGNPIDHDIFKFKINSREDGIIFWNVPEISSAYIFDAEFSKLHATISTHEHLARLWISINEIDKTIIETEFIDSVLSQYKSRIEADKIREGVS